MYDAVNPVFFEDLLGWVPVCDISGNQADRFFGNLSHLVRDDRRAIAQVIQETNLMSGLKQHCSSVRVNVTRAASDQEFHSRSVPLTAMSVSPQRFTITEPTCPNRP